MVDPLLSLIVPVYGVEEYIGDCLDSILGASDFERYCELIIVDDGSKDGSMAIVEKRCRGLANVTVIRQDNAGLSTARNVGMVKARGQYLWFVDSDDEICHDAITILAGYICRFDPDIVAFEFETMGGVLDRIPYLPVFDELVDPVRFMVSGRPPSPVQFYLFKRACVEGLGQRFMPGIYHEDSLFTPSVLVRAASLVRTRSVCYRYRLRSGSIMSLSKPDKHLSDMLKIAETLSMSARQMPKGTASRTALGREVGFALASARHYAARTSGADRKAVGTLRRVLAVGAGWWPTFPRRVLINYIRLIGLMAWPAPFWSYRK